jgi:hypothetical protein
VLLTNLDGRELAEGIVGSLFVVLKHPPPCGFADILQLEEQVLVEDLFAEGPVNGAPELQKRLPLQRKRE